jgi:hypothetical protein
MRELSANEAYNLVKPDEFWIFRHIQEKCIDGRTNTGAYLLTSEAEWLERLGYRVTVKELSWNTKLFARHLLKKGYLYYTVDWSK